MLRRDTVLRAAIIALGLLFAVPVAFIGWETGQRLAASSQQQQVPISTVASPTPSEATPTSPATPTTPSADDLARAVVRITLLDEDGEFKCWGSGTFVDATGTILTNYHVIANEGECRYSRLGIEVTTASDLKPELRYFAEAYAVSPEHDLAVIRLTSAVDGGSVTETTPFLTLGDSDTLRLGEDLQLIGYPGIGGETVTFTSGKVAGFAPEPNIDGRAWIKTDGTIAGGNSGGLAANASGQLVGVPTRASSGGTGNVTDCRVVQDTNNDGLLNSDDTCIPIGGFVNALRPVNLAVPLIEEAMTAEPILTSQLGSERAVEDVFEPVISPLRFGVERDELRQPVDPVDSFPSSSSLICGFFDYSGMVDGQVWQAIWSLDGEVLETSMASRPWSGGESGSWWACYQADNGEPLQDGLWELSVFVGETEDPLRTRSVFVGDDHSTVNVTMINRLDADVCTINLSPDLASTWEPNRLGEEHLQPGSQITRTLPAGTYDVRVLDCEGENVSPVDTLVITEGSVITLE